MDPDKYRSSGVVEPRGPYVQVKAILILWFNGIQGIKDA
jgi:hypothetical protein